MGSRYQTITSRTPELSADAFGWELQDLSLEGIEAVRSAVGIAVANSSLVLGRSRSRAARMRGGRGSTGTDGALTCGVLGPGGELNDLPLEGISAGRCHVEVAVAVSRFTRA